MEVILLVGAVFNIIGGIGILGSVFVVIPVGYPGIPETEDMEPKDYMQFRIFCAGTAFTFGIMYYYIYLNPQYAVPFLFFGMGLKFWAFLSSLIATIKYQMPKKICLLFFGVPNLIVGILFAIYLFHVTHQIL